MNAAFHHITWPERSILPFIERKQGSADDSTNLVEIYRLSFAVRDTLCTVGDSRQRTEQKWLRHQDLVRLVPFIARCQLGNFP
jgi:hypothetical protein